MPSFSTGSSHRLAHRSRSRCGFGGGGSSASISGSTTISSIRSIVTYWRRRRKRDCFLLGLYLKVSISLVRVCCSTVALTLAYGTVGFPMMVNFFEPTRSTVPKTTFSPASRRCSFSHCTRSPTVTLCWWRTPDLNTAKQSLVSSFPTFLSQTLGSGFSDWLVLWGMSLCQMNEHVGLLVGYAFGSGFQWRAILYLSPLIFVDQVQRSFRSA
mmetsp:Transcript_13868/g.41339  ORF Transcript_13868/g.41339 Transcript_13868/m.41339 type:complete len:212 (-) Transcript_13868:250-885(-)